MSDGTIAGKEDHKFVLGVDLDGVVSDFVGDVRLHAAEWFGVPLDTLTSSPDYSFTQWGHGMPEAYPALHKFAVVNRDMFINSKPILGAPQALRSLSEKGVYIRIITSRICIKCHHAEIVKQTVDWLEKHGIPYWDLCFVKDKLAVNADVYIDDSPGNILKLRKHGKSVITFGSSVNYGVPGLRANNWKEAEQMVLKARGRGIDND